MYFNIYFLFLCIAWDNVCTWSFLFFTLRKPSGYHSAFSMFLPQQISFRSSVLLHSFQAYPFPLRCPAEFCQQQQLPGLPLLCYSCGIYCGHFNLILRYRYSLRLVFVLKGLRSSQLSLDIFCPVWYICFSTSAVFLSITKYLWENLISFFNAINKIV